MWGKHDPAFIPAGALAYRKDLPNAEVHLLDAGHFALETRDREIAAYMIPSPETALPIEPNHAGDDCPP